MLGSHVVSVVSASQAREKQLVFLLFEGSGTQIHPPKLQITEGDIWQWNTHVKHVLKIFQPSGKFMRPIRRVFQISCCCCEVFDIDDRNFFITECKCVLLKVHSSELDGEKLRPFTAAMEDASRFWIGEKASVCPLGAFQAVLKFLDLPKLLLCKPHVSYIFRWVCSQGASLI